MAQTRSRGNRHPNFGLGQTAGSHSLAPGHSTRRLGAIRRVGRSTEVRLP